MAAVFTSRLLDNQAHSGSRLARSPTSSRGGFCPVSLGAPSSTSSRATLKTRTKVMAFQEEPHGEQRQQLSPSSPPPSPQPSAVDPKLLAVVLSAFLAFGAGVWTVANSISGVELRLTEKISGVEHRLTEKISSVEQRLTEKITSEISSLEHRLDDKIDKISASQAELLQELRSKK